MSPVSQPEPVAQVAKPQDQPLEQMQMAQPRANQPMNPQQPHPNSEPELSLRGGEDCHGWCRGRLCSLIPCPIPIHCCVF
ncbi:hypothetical protein FGRMN_2063 [Fusarium graminum]|nr:hypothetical protein FGRMN_2063 [Fusarium graminum]